MAGAYESIDRRRGEQLQPWLSSVLSSLARDFLLTNRRPPTRFVDLGSGLGFLARHASPFFPEVTLVDLSPEVLARANLPGARKICADIGGRLPLAPGQTDFVGAFATLHHVFDPGKVFSEAHRILKPGGIFYSDHDLEAGFAARWRLPLSVYRLRFDHGPLFLRQFPALDPADYELAEFHGQRGLCGHSLAQRLREIGFREVRAHYHWDGMLGTSRSAQATSRRLPRERGWAPALRLVAIK